jgi:2-amino-4-hydroxy-6-hydroxymethyldihydropteridine diphosphokinase
MNADPVRVYVAAGSNVDPHRQLRRALEGLEARFGSLTVSPAYANTAVGFVGEDFVNLVFGFTTTRPVAEVLAGLHAVEADCGRPRDAAKFGPRAMDLDLLLYGDQVGTVPGAVLPRPDLVKRPYMLGPLADIAPTLIHPTLHRTIRELWSAFDQAGHELRLVVL